MPRPSTPPAPPEPRAPRKRSLQLLFLLAAAVLLPLAGLAGAGPFLSGQLDALRGLGLVTIPFYMLAVGVVIGLALIPSHVASFAAGFLYGFWAGVVAALGAIIVGVFLSFQVTRRMTREQLRDWTERFTWSRVLVRELIDTSPAKAFLAVALARLPPQVPYALGNIVAASCGVRLLPLLFGTAIGILPRAGLVVLIGSGLSEWEPGAPLPGELKWAVAAALVGFGGLFLWSGLILRKRQAGPG